jgi:putative ABC transport system ATP-binding protein
MISLTDVNRDYATGRGLLRAIRHVTLDVERGAWVTLVGPSGSGKSTLLNLIAGLDRPTSGRLVVAGMDLGALSEEALARWRARNVGIVFQFFQLLPTLTALENVLLPMEFAGRDGDRRAAARALLESVGLAHLADHLPGELSGGEQQRVAIARALANDPPLLVADEPTGNLDAASGEAVIELLVDYWRGGGTLLLVTHDPTIAARAPRLLTMGDGALRGDVAIAALAS